MPVQRFGPLEGRVALVTGAASGIGLACAEVLWEQGALVAGLDVNRDVTIKLSREGQWGCTCDIRDKTAVSQAVDATISRFGTLDILVSNAGVFTARKDLAEMDDDTWSYNLDVNLTGAQRTLTLCIPHLKKGRGACVVFIGSRNVHAPGRGASAYSVSKAGLTQLARVAALELAPFGIRVNIVHPDAVFDTGIWTPERLEESARAYNMTTDEYKTKNLLKREVSSRDVAVLVSAIAGPAFEKTTGAQISIDAGNERVI